MSDSVAIHTDRLVKSFRKRRVVNGISFELGQGEVVGLVRGEAVPAVHVDGQRGLPSGRGQVQAELGRARSVDSHDPRGVKEASAS